MLKIMNGSGVVARQPDGRRGCRTLVVVNRNSGTVRSLGSEAVHDCIAEGFGKGAEVDVAVVSPSEIDRLIDNSLRERSHDVIVVGGGDGTISAVAGRLAGSEIALGILPLGTMNMMAKAIGLKPALDEAIRQVAEGAVCAVDVGRINDRIFLHQVSFGLQPRMVRIREKIGYRSRMTKMISTSLAVLTVLARPRRIRAEGMIDGNAVQLKLPVLAISNNLYRDDRPAVPNRLDGGELGVYQVNVSGWGDYLRLALAALRGTWRKDEVVDASRASRVRLEFRRRSRKPRMLASVDGELIYVSSPVEIAIMPAALRMVLPEGEGGLRGHVERPDVQSLRATNKDTSSE